MTRHITGQPKNLPTHFRPLTPPEYRQCQQCGHRNQHVAPYHRPWTRRADAQSFCQPSCKAVREQLNEEEQ